MRNPKNVKIIIFGLEQNDVENYFIDPKAYIEQEQPPDFPLNLKNKDQGILVQRLINYIEIKYPLKVIKGKLIFSFYNHNTKKFEKMQKLLKDEFILLNQEFCDKEKPLLIKLSFILDKQYIRNIFKENEDEILSLKKKLDKLKKQLKYYFDLLKKLNEEKNQDNSKNKKYDVAILYSNPLEQNYKPVEFNEEIRNFMKRMQDLNKNFSYFITQATKQNLKKVLRQHPKIIHIISHGGIKNDETYLQFEKELKNQKENDNLDEVSQSQISKIVNKPYHRALIFFGCCHSGGIAEKFREHGYPTIAIDRYLKLKDQAAIPYFQCFYEKLLQNQGNKLTFLECHEEAKKYVKNKLKDCDFQDCESHSHTENCKKVFLELSFLRIRKLKKILQNSTCCKPQQDILKHKWDVECKVKEEFKTSLQLQDEDQINNFIIRLDKVAEKNKGILKICCCELAEIYYSGDFENYLIKPELQIEHQSSKTFQFFGDQQCRIFNFIEDGHSLTKNKIEWNEEYVARYEKAKNIVNNLFDIFEEQEKISKIMIIEIEIGQENLQIKDEIILFFVEQVTYYFRQRYINQSTLKDIKIKVLENINQISQFQEQEQELIKYVFIIKITYEEWEKNKEDLMNQKVVIIIIIDVEKKKCGDKPQKLKIQFDSKIQKVDLYIIDKVIKIFQEQFDKQQQQN